MLEAIVQTPSSATGASSPPSRSNDLEPDPARQPLVALRRVVTGVRRRSLFRIGETVAGCTIRRLIGQGGMGQVFEAHDPLLQRTVAIKTGWPDRGADAIRREARALAAIAHRCVPVVHATGNHEGVEFFVMERIQGRTLEDYLRDGDLRGILEPLPDAIALLLDLACGLAAVHRAGVIHRDVKPSNVMLAPGGRVVLMDFGICSARCDEGITLETSGSPAYMAPETITNSLEPGTGYLVDVYAFGVLAFEILTGSVPYGAASIDEVFQAHLVAPVPDLRARRPEVPPRLAALVSELLAKDPCDRPTDMEEVAHRLSVIGRTLRG